MLSKLDDDCNRKLLVIFSNVLKLDAMHLTKMSDRQVLEIYLKLSFQHRNNCGLFEMYGSFPNERNDIDYIDSQLANLELLS